MQNLGHEVAIITLHTITDKFAFFLRKTTVGCSVSQKFLTVLHLVHYIHQPSCTTKICEFLNDDSLRY
jgi:hypothetical protein